MEELSDKEKKILKGLSSNKSLFENFEFISKRYSMSKGDVIRGIYNLWKKGYIELVPNRKINSFFQYLFSIEAFNFHVIVTLVLINALLVFYVKSPPLIYARYVIGSIFVLYLPGYALIDALYPREDQLDALERVALSIGLSLALVPLVGLLLNYTPWGIRLTPIVFSLSILTIGLYFYATYRKYQYFKLKFLST